MESNERACVLIDPDHVADTEVPTDFTKGGGSIKVVDGRVLRIATLLGRLAARDYLREAAANDNEPPEPSAEAEGETEQ